MENSTEDNTSTTNNNFKNNKNTKSSNKNSKEKRFNEKAHIKQFLLSQNGVPALITSNNKKSISSKNILDKVSDYYMFFLDRMHLKNSNKRVKSYSEDARVVEKILEDKDIQNVIQNYY